MSAPVELSGAVWELLQEWLPANDEPDRPLMTLSTVDQGGLPDARTVLLSEYDRTGFYFHTDSRSRKAEQLHAAPGTALTFAWPGFTRQLVVQGLAEPAPVAEIAAAYRARRPYLQQLAWQNTAEFARLPQADRVAAWARFAAEHAEGFEQPETWAGYLVRPHRLTFWHGTPETASLRTEYTPGPDGWQLTLLPG